MELLENLDYSKLMKNKANWKKELLTRTNFREIKIAVLCGSTFGIAQDFLELLLLNYGIKAEFFIGEYNRFYEDAVFNNPSLEKFKPDVILLYVTNKNLLLSQDYTLNESVSQLSEKEVQRWERIWNNISEVYRCMVIQNNFELFRYRMTGNTARTSGEGVLRYIDNINYHISRAVEKDKNLYLNDINYLSATVGLTKWYDDKMWQLYKYAINMESLPLYALNTANIIKSIFGMNKKAIATDLDNTLWGGIIGEVGESGIQQGMDTPQGEAYSQLQKYLKFLAKQGILLNVCSKNEHETACAGLRSPSAVLKEKDFVKINANWKNKPENIREIAGEINIMPEAFVFLDDSVLECESVQALCPGTLSLHVESPMQIMGDLELLSPFEGEGGSAEDALRVQMYQSEVSRNADREEYSTYEEYLASLETKCVIEKLNEDNIERVVKLLNKTNQFNFMTNRYTIQQFRGMNDSADVMTFVARLSDKFGDMGIVSVMTLFRCDGIAVLHDWVMSCRVLERKVENVLLYQAFQFCRKYGLHSLIGLYLPTAKNMKIKTFFASFDFQQCTQESKNYNTLLHKIENIGIDASQVEIWVCDAIMEAKEKIDIALINVEG